MANSDIYIWRYDLAGFGLTKGVSNDYIARVATNKSLSLSNVASLIASERTDLRADTLLTAATLMDDKVKDLVCQGFTVVTGSAVYQPTITGTFIGRTGEFDSSRNACTVSVSASQSLREMVATVTPEFTGTIKDTGGAQITKVTDSETGDVDGRITPGNTITIVGNKIKCLDADGTGNGTVRFINTDTNEQTEVSKFTKNKPSELILIVPAALKDGTYKLQIETYYSSGSTMLKEARTIEYAVTLTVYTETSEDTSSSDESNSAE